MIRLFLSIVFLCFLTSAGAQHIDGIPLQDLHAPYIQINAVRKPFGSKLLVTVDYGQARKRTQIWPTVTDEAGEYLTFDSPIQVLNFFFEYDYELVKDYSGLAGDIDKYTFLLRKVYYLD